MEKIAIIDLGSNTARLLIIDVMDDGHFVIVDQLKEAPRLGEGVDKDGLLKPERIQETIRVLKMFKKLCDAYKIERILAIATAAVRRAKNQRGFLDEVVATCGIRFKVLSAEEEAMFVYRGVINTMDIPKGLIMEIGGGSTKLIYYKRRNLLNFVTLPFGAITLTEMFKDEGSPDEQVKKVENFVFSELEKIDWLKEIEPETQLIGVGGSFRNLCRMNKIMKKYPLKTIHNYVVSDAEFNHTYNLIKGLELDKKKKIKGLSSGRADILPSAFAAIYAVKNYMKLEDITVSGSGLRTGLVFNYAIPSTEDRPLSDVLNFSLNTITEYYGCDKQHVDQIVNLSVQLFKQLRVLHKFPRQYLKILKVAAALSEVGMKVQFYNYEKHSSYIILNSNLYGISHRDIVMASFVAGFNNIEDVNPIEWAKYRDFLTDEDLDAVRKMGVMLRLAKGFDRSMSSIVKSINCDILGDSVIMKTEVEKDALLELNSAFEVSQDFRKYFKKNLEIL